MPFIRICAAVLTAIFCFGAHYPAWAQAGDWEWYRSERFGYSLLFPADLLSPREESQNGRGMEFISEDGSTKLKVLVVSNEDRVTPCRGHTICPFSVALEMSGLVRRGMGAGGGSDGADR